MDATQQFIANVAILSSEMAEESWDNTFWAPFSGNVDISTRENGQQIMRPSGNPIEILDSYIAEGRDNMLLPFLKRLAGSPSFGDTYIKGTGEKQSLWWLRSYINQVRKAVEANSGNMALQRQKAYRMIERVRPQLQEWITMYENQECSRAYYEGVSQNLSASTALEGLGVVKRYHPNLYTNATGVLTTAGTAKQFKTAAELDLAVTAANEPLNNEILTQLRIKMMELRIPQMVTEDGYKYWVLLAHPTQIATLLADTAYAGSTREAFSTLQSNPEMRGCVGYWQGFAIFEDIVAVRAWDNAAGGFFGDDDAVPFTSATEPTTITDNICAIAFGNQSMGKGVAEYPRFTTEIDDHENISEVAFRMQNGYNRADHVAEANATEASGGVFYKNTTGGVAPETVPVINQSSLILMTSQS